MRQGASPIVAPGDCCCCQTPHALEVGVRLVVPHPAPKRSAEPDYGARTVAQNGRFIGPPCGRRGDIDVGPARIGRVTAPGGMSAPAGGQVDRALLAAADRVNVGRAGQAISITVYVVLAVGIAIPVTLTGTCRHAASLTALQNVWPDDRVIK